MNYKDNDYMKEAVKNKIGKDLSFGSKLEKSTINTYHKALERYYSGFNDAKNLSGRIPIFLDTNVLLRIYSISFKDREKLEDFFESKKDRFVVTNQVQKEFTKNREGTIEKFFDNLSTELADKFKNDIINKIQSYLDTNKVELKDFSFIEEQLEQSRSLFTEIYEKIKLEVKKKKEDNIGLKHKDKILKIYTNFEILPSLNDSEIEHIKKEFDSLKANIDESKLITELDKPNKAFPGAGDIKKKPKDPYADYIIFHEILKHMKNNSTDAIFITYDATKKDWLKSNKEPYLHYVEIVYQNTEKSLFILDAKSLFEEILDATFESLIENKSQNVNSLIHQIIAGYEILIQMIRDVVVHESKNLLKPDERQFDLNDEVNLFQLLFDFDIISFGYLHELRELHDFSRSIDNSQSYSKTVYSDYKKRIELSLNKFYKIHEEMKL